MLNLGTATILVDVEDENDNPPRFAREDWTAKADETFQKDFPSSEVILEAAVNDPDRNNYFSCRVSSISLKKLN